MIDVDVCANDCDCDCVSGSDNDNDERVLDWHGILMGVGVGVVVIVAVAVVGVVDAVVIADGAGVDVACARCSRHGTSPLVRSSMISSVPSLVGHQFLAADLNLKLLLHNLAGDIYLLI